jgi:hypothetical protein
MIFAVVCIKPDTCSRRKGNAKKDTFGAVFEDTAARSSAHRYYSIPNEMRDCTNPQAV